MTTQDNLTPQQRLASSRQAIVGYMGRNGNDEPSSSGTSGTASDAPTSGGHSSFWKTVTRTLQAWWRHHPAHTAIDVAVGMAHPVLNRYAHQKPLHLVGAAAALGAALVVVRPWRLVSITGLLLATFKSSGLTNTLLSLLSTQSQLTRPSESATKTHLP